MSELGLSVAWCVLQVTLLASAVSICYLVCRRSRPGFRSSVAATGVFVVLVLSVLSVSPYPNWTQWLGADSSSRPSRTARVGGESQASRRNAPKLSARENPRTKVDSSRSPAEQSANGHGEIAAGDAAAEVFESGRDERFDTPSQGVWSWTLETLAGFASGAQRVFGLFRNWIAGHSDWLLFWGRLFGGLLLCGIGWNLLQLFFGWLSLRQFRARATRVESSVLQECLDIVQAILGVKTRIELCQTTEMTSPATVGWWRPVVILPADWEEWSDEERLGVLAHEVAHVQRKDYLTGLLSQVVLSLHFYHPLINWLVSRLQLDQELAADAAAVRVLGSNKAYLKLLAGMALKDHTSPAPRSARTFFPQRATLMARVEMLRGNLVEAGEGSFSWRTGMRGVLVCLGLVLAGLRPLVGSDRATVATDTLNAAFIPDSSIAVAAWRPGAVPDSHPLARLLTDLSGDLNLADMAQVRQIALFWLDPSSRTGKVQSVPRPSGAVLGCSSVAARKVVRQTLERLQAEHAQKRVLGGMAVGDLKLDEAGDADLVIALDAKALAIALAAKPQRESKAEWCQRWDEAGPADVRILVCPSRLHHIWQPEGEFAQPLGEVVNKLSGWEESVEFALGSFQQSAQNCALVIAPRPGSSLDDLRQPVQELLQDWRNRLLAADKSPVDATVILADAVQGKFDAVPGNGFCREIVETAQLDSSGSRLKMELPASGLLGVVFGLQSPAGRAVADEAWNHQHVSQFDQSMRFLVEALQAYERDHGHLAAAVQRSPDEPVHSWRVALLPYLGRKDLFDRYHFDQSWDSPANLALLGEIPDTYRGFGSLTDSAQFCLGESLGKDVSEWLTDDWTEVRAIVLLGSAGISIPWTCPEDGRFVGQWNRSFDAAAGGAVAELKNGQLERRVWGDRLVSQE